MIEYYSDLMERHGGSSEAFYITGLAIITESGLITIEIQEDSFILTSKIDESNNHRGNPLDVITIEPSNGKYFSEMTDEENMTMCYGFDIKVVEFLKVNFVDDTRKKQFK